MKQSKKKMEGRRFFATFLIIWIFPILDIHIGMCDVRACVCVRPQCALCYCIVKR